MFDIVTLVFHNELNLLPVQAESIERYAQDLDLGQILVVVNDSDDIAEKISPGWWGRLSNRVKVIPRSQFNTQYVENGWLSQQLLKMQGAALCASPWSIILDAKTIFIRPLKQEKIIDAHGRVRCHWIPVIPVFQPAADIAKRLFNIEQQNTLNPAGVPFFSHNDTLRAMIRWIEENTQQDFPTWFQSQGMLTEFVLYSMWVLKTQPDLYTDVGSDWLSVCNVCHTQAHEFDDILTRQLPTATTISVHRIAWAQLTSTQQRRFKEILINKTIYSARLL